MASLNDRGVGGDFNRSFGRDFGAYFVKRLHMHHICCRLPGNVGLLGLCVGRCGLLRCCGRSVNRFRGRSFNLWCAVGFSDYHHAVGGRFGNSFIRYNIRAGGIGKHRGESPPYHA